MEIFLAVLYLLAGMAVGALAALLAQTKAGQGGCPGCARPGAQPAPDAPANGKTETEEQRRAREMRAFYEGMGSILGYDGRRG